MTNVFLMACFLLINVTYAQDLPKNNYHGFETKEKMIRNLEENNVSKEKILLLVEKTENNEPWDIDKQECIDSIPKDFYVFDPKEGSQERYYRFDDGSFVKISNEMLQEVELNIDNKTEQFLSRNMEKNIASSIFLDLKNNGVSPSSVEHGTGYAHYYDFKVSHSVGAMYAEMYVEFYNIQNGNDEIISSGCYGPNAYGFGTLGQMPTIDIVRNKEDSARNRWALANANWYVNHRIDTMWGGSDLSGTYYLWLGVGNDRYVVSPRLPY